MITTTDRLWREAVNNASVVWIAHMGFALIFLYRERRATR
jgi:hypothetical protein